MPDLSALTTRISGPASEAWKIGDIASERMRTGEDIIHLGVGDPDIDTPLVIQNALFDAVKSGKTHYSPLAGECETRAAIAAHGSGLYGGDINAEQVAVCVGAQGALYSTFSCIAGVDDEVIVLEPSYATYPAVVTAGGAKMVTVVLDKKGGYQLDLEKIKAAVTPRTKAILINSPGNPSGAGFDQDDLGRLAQLCSDRSIWLVSDEVYWSLCYDGPHRSPYKSQALRETMIIVNSLSKSHAMSGWRLGWAIGPQCFIKAMTDLAQATTFGVNQFVQIAAIAALNETRAPQEIRQLFRGRRDALCEGLAKSRTLHFSKPRGGMFVLADISRTGIDGETFAAKLLDAENVAVVPGFGFGASMKNTIRIGFLRDEEILRDAAARIVRFADNQTSATCR